MTREDAVKTAKKKGEKHIETWLFSSCSQKKNLKVWNSVLPPPQKKSWKVSNIPVLCPLTRGNHPYPFLDPDEEQNWGLPAKMSDLRNSRDQSWKPMSSRFSLNSVKRIPGVMNYRRATKSHPCNIKYSSQQHNQSAQQGQVHSKHKSKASKWC